MELFFSSNETVVKFQLYKAADLIRKADHNWPLKTISWEKGLLTAVRKRGTVAFLNLLTNLTAGAFFGHCNLTEPHILLLQGVLFVRGEVPTVMQVKVSAKQLLWLRHTCLRFRFPHRTAHIFAGVTLFKVEQTEAEYHFPLLWCYRKGTQFEYCRGCKNSVRGHAKTTTDVNKPTGWPWRAHQVQAETLFLCSLPTETLVVETVC